MSEGSSRVSVRGDMLALAELARELSDQTKKVWDGLGAMEARVGVIEAGLGSDAVDPLLATLGSVSGSLGAAMVRLGEIRDSARKWAERL